MSNLGRPGEETFWQKAVRKCINEPLVPIGALVTVGFLGSGLSAFHKGQKGKAQLLMRGRVVAQAFTVIAMGIGAYYGMKPHQRPTNVQQILEKKESSS